VLAALAGRDTDRCRAGQGLRNRPGRTPGRPAEDCCRAEPPAGARRLTAAGTGAASRSADYGHGRCRRTAALDRQAILIPADAIGLGLCRRPGDPELPRFVPDPTPSTSLMAYDRPATIPPSTGISEEHQPERSRCRRTKHATLRAGEQRRTCAPSPQPHAPRPGHNHVLLVQALITSNHLDHVMTAHRCGAEAGGEDPPDQEGSACRSWRQCSRQPADHPLGW
jgi:hypothetical protein